MTACAVPGVQHHGTIHPGYSAQHAKPHTNLPHCNTKPCHAMQCNVMQCHAKHSKAQHRRPKHPLAPFPHAQTVPSLSSATVCSCEHATLLMGRPCKAMHRCIDGWVDGKWTTTKFRKDTNEKTDCERKKTKLDKKMLRPCSRCRRAATATAACHVRMDTFSPATRLGPGSLSLQPWPSVCCPP